MENKKPKDKRELVQDEIILTSVEAQQGSFQEEGKIVKLIFNAVNDIGTELRISFKPKIKKHVFDDGFKKTWEDFPKAISELPKNVRIIAQKVNTLGKLRVKAKYQAWNQWSDELQKHKDTIRYVQTMKHMEEWEIVGDSVIIETKKIEKPVETYSEWINNFSTDVIEITNKMNQEFLKKGIQTGDIFQPKPGFMQRLI